ncbi:ABC transporter permease [Pseudoalteromonas denitrificans]|nr:ABC transporter permease [Pseudoalteromonas denitrificans]
MVFALAIGVAASMTTITVNYLSSKNPLPHKENNLFAVQLDNWSIEKSWREPDITPFHLTYIDANNLLSLGEKFKHSPIAQMDMPLESTSIDGEKKTFMAQAKSVSHDFFALFDVPFLYGQAWSKEDDKNSANLVVISEKTNNKFFSGANSVGKTLIYGGEVFTIIGVTKKRTFLPKLYATNVFMFAEPEDLYFPFSTQISLGWFNEGKSIYYCQKDKASDTYESLLQSECMWILFWAEFKDKAEKEQYQQFIDNYVSDQKALGRFPRPLDNRLTSIKTWFKYQNVTNKDTQILMWLAILFLCVCLFNTVGLMLAKFTGKSSEVALRRALGASKQSIFYQYLIESLCIGLCGGVLGMLLTFISLEYFKHIYTKLNDQVMTLNIELLLSGLLLSILATLIAGIYPTIKVSRTSACMQLRQK